jgi:hypothetical protein
MFKEDILLRAVRFQVLCVFLQSCRKIITVWFPCLDITGVKFEDAESNIASEHRIIFF